MTSASLRRNPGLDTSKTMAEEATWYEKQGTISKAVEACQKGDPTAQRCLYEASNQNVYRLMVRMVGLQDAADLTQQVFLQVFRKIEQFSGQAHLGTWLYRVAVNEALQHLRRSKRLRLQVLEYEPMDDSSGRDKQIADEELLERALHGLEPDLRCAFLLREVEGLSYRQIADALQIPEGTVGSRLNRARRELKQHLLELGWEP